MVRMILLAAAASAAISGPALADPTSEQLNYGMLHWIRDTVCQPGREIVFVPVSHDVPTLKGEWAVMGMDDPDPDSAHIVTLSEKTWLKANGCDEDVPRSLQMAGRETGSAGLGL